MALSSRSKLAIAAAALLSLGACAEYMNNWDTISFRAGNAPEANSEIHEIYPWNRNVNNTKID